MALLIVMRPMRLCARLCAYAMLTLAQQSKKHLATNNAKCLLCKGNFGGP